MTDCKKIKIDLKDYFSKLNTNDAASITKMIIDTLGEKVEELCQLYTTLSKTYPVEIGLTGISVIAQVVAPAIYDKPVAQIIIGTKQGTTDNILQLLKKSKEIVKMMEETTSEQHSDSQG